MVEASGIGGVGGAGGPGEGAVAEKIKISNKDLSHKTKKENVRQKTPTTK